MFNGTISRKKFREIETTILFELHKNKIYQNYN